MHKDTMGLMEETVIGIDLFLSGTYKQFKRISGIPQCSQLEFSHLRYQRNSRVGQICCTGHVETDHLSSEGKKHTRLTGKSDTKTFLHEVQCLVIP